MKHLIYILFFLTVGFSACQRHTAYPSAMQQAEALMVSRPDSALTLLGSMTDTLAMLSEEARMYHSLLTIQAKDKLYITHTNDSLINRIVAFYEDKGDKDRLMMAYFYQGSTYRDMNDAPRALKAFHQAIDAGKDTKNLTLLGQTYGQMGTLLSYQKLYDEALEAKRKALQLYTLQKDSTRYPYLNRDMARIYRAKEEYDSALHYYNMAYHFTKDFKLRKQRNNIMSELGCLYYRMGRADMAKPILNNVVAENGKAFNALLFLGIIHKEQARTDSAYFYLSRALNSRDINHCRTAYFHLYQLAETEGNKNESALFLQNFHKLQDSINNITQTEATDKYHILYQFQRTEKENDALNLENQQKLNQIYGLIILSILAITSATISIIYYLKEKETTKLQKLRLEKLQEQQQKNNQANLKKTIRLDISGQKKDETGNTNPYTGQDWEKLQAEVERHFPRFTERLYLLYPDISQQEFRVCLLLKAGIRIKDIAQLLEMKSTAITHLRSRLYTKITNSKGTGKDLDCIIADL